MKHFLIKKINNGECLGLKNKTYWIVNQCFYDFRQFFRSFGRNNTSLSINSRGGNTLEILLQKGILTYQRIACLLYLSSS